MNCKNPRILTRDEVAYLVANYQRTMTSQEVADYLKMDKKRLVRTASRLRGKGHDIAMTYDRENPRTKDLSRLAKRNPELAAKVRAERKRTAAAGIARQIAREAPKNVKRSRGAIDYTANPKAMKIKPIDFTTHRYESRGSKTWVLKAIQ